MAAAYSQHRPSSLFEQLRDAVCWRLWHSGLGRRYRRASPGGIWSHAADARVEARIDPAHH
jgi:hypothetical protein